MGGSDVGIGVLLLAALISFHAALEAETRWQAHYASWSATLNEQRQAERELDRCKSQLGGLKQRGYDLISLQTQMNATHSVALKRVHANIAQCNRTLSAMQARETDVEKEIMQTHRSIDEIAASRNRRRLREKAMNAIAMLQRASPKQYAQLPNDNIRNTLIVALRDKSNYTLAELQRRSLDSLLHLAMEIQDRRSTKSVSVPSCEGQPAIDGAMLAVLAEVQEETMQKSTRSAKSTRTCYDDVRNALIDAVQSRTSRDVAGIQALSDAELIATVQKLLRRGVLPREGL